MRSAAPLVLALLALACQVGRSSPPPLPDQERRAAVVVESIEPILGQSFPVQVRVLIRGHLSGACRLAEPTVERDGEVFRVVLRPAAEGGEACRDPQPFQRGVVVPTHGLSKGRYRVLVDGHETAFTLAQDDVGARRSGTGRAPSTGG